MVNLVVLIGYVGHPPEQKHTAKGDPFCSFTLATDDARKGSDGELKKYTTWHHITIWGKQSEAACRFIRKGSKIYVEGSIRTREKEGKTYTDIVANEFRLLDRPPESVGVESKPAPAF